MLDKTSTSSFEKSDNLKPEVNFSWDKIWFALDVKHLILWNSVVTCSVTVFSKCVVHSFAPLCSGVKWWYQIWWWITWYQGWWWWWWWWVTWYQGSPERFSCLAGFCFGHRTFKIQWSPNDNRQKCHDIIICVLTKIEKILYCVLTLIPTVGLSTSLGGEELVL